MTKRIYETTNETIIICDKCHSESRITALEERRRKWITQLMWADQRLDFCSVRCLSDYFAKVLYGVDSAMFKIPEEEDVF